MPNHDQDRAEQLARTNPLFGPAKLKLGTFCTNASSGATMSSAEGVFQLSWPNSLELARRADDMKFEAIVPIGRWRGFGGETDFNGQSFETMTFATAVAATTNFPAAFGTVHVPSLHPVMAAKQAATIDHVSAGRFALNIVTGWNDNEIALFGSAMLPHDERYNVAAEWVSLMKLLWTEDGPVDFSGKYFEVKDALLRPQPVQPYPALMSAGASSKGRAFAAEHCDMTFTSLGERDVASIRATVDSFRSLAAREFKRDLKVWITAYMIIGDTEDDARRQFDHFVIKHGDQQGVENLLRSMKVNSQALPPAILDKLKLDFIAGWAGYALVGTKEQIVREMEVLAAAGVDGVLLTWPAFSQGMQRFQEEVHPLLVQAGLR